MASTNSDTDRKRCRTPAWDPPKLLLVVGGLNVGVGTLSVVGVIIDGGVWPLGSNIWLRQPRRKERGKRGRKATVSTIQSTRTQGSTLHMHGYLCKGATSVD